MKSRYNIQPIFADRYAGIKCILYYDENKGIITEDNGMKISITIFRTGNVMIIGKFSKMVLKYAFEYFSNILITYENELKEK